MRTRALSPSLAIVLALASCAPRAADPAAPPRAVGEAACGSCHRAEAAEWRASLHHASLTDADFQRSYHAEPRPACRGCHAPLGVASATRGVGCTSCHEVGDAHPAASAKASTRPCGTCHDFDAPGSRAILQSTAREHALSAFAATPCASCHMAPRRDGGHDHRFGITRDPAALARALRVDSAAALDGAVVVTLSARDVGHRFPTGDLFRRLTVTLTAFDAKGGLVAADSFHLGRDWDAHRRSLQHGDAETVGEDSRLGGEPRPFRLPCPAAPARVHLAVTYERGASAEGDFFEAFAATEILDTDLTLGPAR